MAISDRRKIVAALTLAAGGFGLIGVSSGATFTDTVTGSFTVKADFPITPTATATPTVTPTATVTAADEPTPSVSVTSGTPGAGSGSETPPGSGSATPTVTPTPTPPPTPSATPAGKLTTGVAGSDWFATDAPVYVYKNKDIGFTGAGAKSIGDFTAGNSGGADLKVTVDVTLPAELNGKVTAVIRQVSGPAVLKGGGEPAVYQLWLTPTTSNYTIPKSLAKGITFTLGSVPA
jgi:hypothetical protein